MNLSRQDVDRYVGMALNGWLGLVRPDRPEVYTYETRKPLRIADAEKVSNYLLDNYGQDKQIQKARAVVNSMKNLEFMTEVRIKKSDLSRKDKKFALGVMKNYERSENIVHKCVAQLGREPIQSKTISEFMKRGYDAIVDVQDTPIASYPMILLNPKDSISLVSSSPFDELF